MTIVVLFHFGRKLMAGIYWEKKEDNKVFLEKINEAWCALHFWTAKFASCLNTKFKISKLSHRMRILHAYV